MDYKKLFEKHYSRLVREGVLKALLCGLIIGFAVNFVVAFALWFTSLGIGAVLAVSIGAGVLVAAIATAGFYFKKFRPTTEKIAKRLDLTGLEERLITMKELENDTSYIALRQREDAQAKLREVDGNRIKIHVSRATVIAASILFVLGSSMTTVTTLSAAGIIESGKETIIDPIVGEDPEEYIPVSYIVEEGGYIEGESEDAEEQLVLKGGYATLVVAVADEGWMFQNWSDGLEEPARQDGPITEPLEIYAVFVQVEEGGEGEGEGGDEGEPGDEPSDQPSEGGEGGDSNDPDSDPNNGAGGKYEEKNQIIDGETYYRDVYEEYYKQAMEILASGGELTEEQKAFIEMYFNILL